MNTALATLDSFSDQIAALDARWILVALAFQLGNLSCRAIAWRGILVSAYPDARIRLLDVGAGLRGRRCSQCVPSRPRGRGREDRPRPAPDSRLDGRRRRRLERGRPALRHSRRRVSADDRLGAWACACLAASVPADRRRSGRRTRCRRNRCRRRPSASREPAPGCSILATPRLYLRRVVPYQAGAWACRLGVAFAMLAAFGVPATVPIAGLVVVASGMSTLVPATPGGAGTQQLLIVSRSSRWRLLRPLSLLDRDASRGHLVNTIVGVVAIMLVFGTMRPATIRAELRR